MQKKSILHRVIRWPFYEFLYGTGFHTPKDKSADTNIRKYQISFAKGAIADGTGFRILTSHQLTSAHKQKLFKLTFVLNKKTKQWTQISCMGLSYVSSATRVMQASAFKHYTAQPLGVSINYQARAKVDIISFRIEVR
jgi:hypothetical protein